MSTGDTLRGPTLHDTSRKPLRPAQARLIYIGSPEAEFASAGRTFALAGFRRVEFKRARRRAMVATIEDDVLRISLPFPWVSGHHADLELHEDTARLVDRNSRNGTLVEGRAIEGCDLSSGEVFEVGRSFWMLREVRPGPVDEPLIDPSGVAHPGHAATLRVLERLAPTRVPILLVGETGSGKNYLAEALHRATGRRGDFVHINVLSQPIDALLYGTGGRAGALERARGGTLFLDDVGELALEEQARLLGALLAAVPTDPDALELPDDGIRLVCASNRDLRAMVPTDNFRGDLYARIAGYEARIPSLRERREDLGLLARALARTDDGQQVKVGVEVFREILDQNWPFNVRELGHCLKAAIAARDPYDDEETGITSGRWEDVAWRGADLPTSHRISSVRHTLMRQLAQYEGDTAAVARSLQCEVADIERWLERFDIIPSSFGRITAPN